MEQTPGQFKSSQFQTPLKQVLADRQTDRQAIRLDDSLTGRGIMKYF